MFVAASAASSAASSAAPSWVAIFGTASAIITAIGLIIAGSFAYFKFVKGRTLHPRCSIDIDPQVVGVGKTHALRVSVTARNEGQTALLVLSDVQQQLLVSQADSIVWQRACDCRQPVRWEESGLPLIEWDLAVPEREALEAHLEDLKAREAQAGDAQAGDAQAREAQAREAQAREAQAREAQAREAQARRKRRPQWWRLKWWLLWRAEMLEHLEGDKLEPGEQWTRSTLVPVKSDSVAYLVCTQIKACRHVAVRHVRAHQRNCCDPESPHLSWKREVYVLPGGKP
jgi:hypothetical protein